MPGVLETIQGLACLRTEMRPCNFDLLAPLIWKYSIPRCFRVMADNDNGDLEAMPIWNTVDTEASARRLDRSPQLHDTQSVAHTEDSGLELKKHLRCFQLWTLGFMWAKRKGDQNNALESWGKASFPFSFLPWKPHAFPALIPTVRMPGLTTWAQDHAEPAGPLSGRLGSTGVTHGTVAYARSR